MESQGYIGEIIEASTVEFIAESRELHAPPRFGSFVKVVLRSGDEEHRAPVTPANDEDPFESVQGSFNREYRSEVDGEDHEDGDHLEPAIYAVVYSASTSSVDAGRRARAYWKDEDELREQQPELSEWLLVTQFQAAIIGYSEDGLVRRYLPPQPPKMHAFVYPCDDREVCRITRRMDFLRILANSRAVPPEEVIAACIREAAEARPTDDDSRRRFKVAAGKELAVLLKEDYERLEAIVRRIGP